MKAVITMYISGLSHKEVITHLNPSIGRTEVNPLGEIGNPEWINKWIVLPHDDPQWELILKTCKNYRTEETDYGYNWADIKFEYTHKELESSKFVHLKFSRQGIINQRVDEYGTTIDDSNVCPQCCFGQYLATDLIIRPKKGRKADIMRTLESDKTIIISSHLADLLKRNRISGYELKPVRVGTIKSPYSKDWFQLIISSQIAFTSDETRWGFDPFHLDPKGFWYCEKHHVRSEREIQSELYLDDVPTEVTDISATKTLCFGQQYVEGYYQPPFPLIVISQKLYRLLVKNKIKGFNAGIVHF